MTVVTVRLTDALGAQAAERAEQSGLTLDEYVGLTLASHLGAVAEVDRYFATRAARTSPGVALDILERAGSEPPRHGDEIT